MPPYLVPAGVFLFGLVFGSFLNVCIYRLPLGRSIVHPGSACPNCAHAIRSYDNVPVFGWMWLGGKCRDCRTPISIRYPLIELTTALLFLACALYFRTPWEIAKYCTLSFLLLGLIFTDIDHQLLPDAMTLPGTALGLGFSFFVWVQGIPGWMPRPQSPLHLRFISFFHSAIGAAVGAGLIYLVGELYFRLRGREGMGFGDVKLMALIGAFLGMRLALFTIFAASLTGALTGLGAMLLVFLKRRRRYRSSGRAWQSARVLYAGFPIPFGVFLGSMALVAAFFGNFILNWYWDQF